MTPRDSTIMTLLLAGTTAFWCYRCKKEHQRALGIVKEDVDDEDDRLTVSTVNSQNQSDTEDDDDDDDDYGVLSCIRHRRSLFPSQYQRNAPPVEKAVIRSLLQAALWAPYHGNCSEQPHPARFVVLGRQSMVEMQRLTLDYYDRSWTRVGFPGSCSNSSSSTDYQTWRKMTEGEITGRWGPVSHMIAIVLRRPSTSSVPEWEDLAAVAAATQNMHVQSTKFPELACYWSSWHDAARDSAEMKAFLGLENEEDRCLGFFIVARAKRMYKDHRRRDFSSLGVEWRP